MVHHIRIYSRLLFSFLCMLLCYTSGFAQRLNNESSLLQFWDTDLCTSKTSVRKQKPEGELSAIAIKVQRAEEQFRTSPGDSSAWLSIRDAIQQLQSYNYTIADAYLHYRMGYMLYVNNQTAPAIEAMLYAKEVVVSLKQKADFPHVASFLTVLGGMYCDYSDYDLGLYYLDMATHYPFCGNMDEYTCWGGIGLANYWQNKDKEALAASMKALALVEQFKDTAEIGSMSGNIGAIYMKLADYKQALFYLEKDYRISSLHKQWKSAGGARLMQAKAFLHQKQYDNAKKALSDADSLYKACNCMTTNSQKEYYAQLSQYYREMGDYQKQARYQDSFFTYFQKLINEKGTSSFRNLELKVVSRVHETQMKLMESERKRGVWLRNSIIIISVFVLIIVLQILYTQRKNRKNEQKIYQLNLNNARKQLDTYLENIRNKNIMLEELQQKLEQNAQTATIVHREISERDVAILAQLEKASLITEEGWAEFTSLVEQVHEHFFTRLNHTFPNLTPAEVRLLTLVKLNFNTKETASMLGISPDSVRKARYRLRKKLALEDESSLENLVRSI
ncbi:hypothetical protein [Edaphocola flava]|uniref:hypothetical protein n=1 Tax=Edaphocola flava TaxID=2499629 RepID=UPI00100A668F|nr:hypothetical protein [Edaphocola flava]